MGEPASQTQSPDLLVLRSAPESRAADGPSELPPASALASSRSEPDRGGDLTAGLSRDLDLRAVRCLLVLAEERNFVRAARRLNLSQPGLTRVIAGLEHRVGLMLVARHKRPVELTPHGLILATHGRQLLTAQALAFDRLYENPPASTAQAAIVREVG
jgi:hypothetical protein